MKPRMRVVIDNEIVPAPAIDDGGAYLAGDSGRPIRVFTDLDVRLMFEGFYAKLAA
jgi:hypothetical protein